jgi:membrane protease YdiL (CAAX protease family)
MLVSAGIARSVPERTTALISAVVLVATAYLLARPAVGEPLRYVGLRPPSPKLVFCALAASLAIILPVMSLEAVALLRFKVPQEVIDALNRMISAKTVPELIYVLLVAALGAALSEEFVFRGILQRSLESRLAAWAAILITAAVFALLHTIWRTPPALVLGIFLGVLYWRTRSLVLPMLAHLTINTVAILALFVTERRGEMAMPGWVRDERPAPWWMILVSLAVFAAAFRVLWREGRPAEQEPLALVRAGDAAPPLEQEPLAPGGQPPDIPVP